MLAALRGPALGLNESELAQIRIRTPDTKIPYYEAVRRYREEEEDALAEKLRAFEEKRARWRLCARNQGVDRLIERIYAETGFLAQAARFRRRVAAGQPASADHAGKGRSWRRRAAHCTRFCGMPSGCARAATA